MFGRKPVSEEYITPFEYRSTDHPNKRNFIPKYNYQYSKPFTGENNDNDYAVDAYFGDSYKNSCIPRPNTYPTIEEINEMDEDTLRINLLRELTFVMIDQIHKTDILHDKIIDLEDRIDELEDTIDIMIKRN